MRALTIRQRMNRRECGIENEAAVVDFCRMKFEDRSTEGKVSHRGQKRGEEKRQLVEISAMEFLASLSAVFFSPLCETFPSVALWDGIDLPP